MFGSRYLVKTCTHRELKFLLRILPGLCKHVKQNQFSVINPICGAHAIVMHNKVIYIMVMGLCRILLKLRLVRLCVRFTMGLLSIAGACCLVSLVDLVPCLLDSILKAAGMGEWNNQSCQVIMD